MGWGDTPRLTLHIAGRDHTTIGWVSDTLVALEYSYNLAAVVEIHHQGYFHDADTIERLAVTFQHLREYSFGTANLLLRQYIPDDAQVQLDFVNAKSSFDVSVRGLGEPIKEVRQALEKLDPIDRAGRREQNRHAAVMNSLEEEERASEVNAHRLNRMLDLIDRVSQSDFGLSREAEAQLKSNIVEQFFRAQSAIEQNDIHVLEGPES